jgi:tetratricopeptide (TPR) repeat protein
MSGRLQLICVLLSVTILPAMAAEEAVESAELPEIFNEPIPLFTKGLGTFTRPISSANKEAQAYFNQGFQMMYAFAKQDATRSFREAHKRDPNCAICFWGEAWSWGSYLNGPMGKEGAPHAYAAIQKAIELAANHATPIEQAYIEAMTVRYVEDFDPEKRLEQDKPYADAMRRLSEHFPDDLDAATLYAEALFVMEPRRGERDIHDPNVKRLHQVLEGILEKDIRHPGGCHLYIHATESTVDPGKAEACSEFIGNSIPGASHINHMPSHTWNEIGRWGDSVRANLQAWHSDLKSDVGEGFAIYPSHNLHMLLFAASMDGQGAIAIQAGKDYAKLTGNVIYHLTTLIRFGRFDEVPALSERPDEPIPGGVWDFAHGYARLRQGESDFAEAHLKRLEQARGESDKFREHTACDLLGVLAGILEGELHREKGDLDGAIRSFTAAVAADDTLVYDEPEPLPFPARHWLGAALLEAKRYAEAERTYRDELADHPHNGWSLFGLQQALEAQGNSSAEVDADLEASWARSDTWLRGSRF